MHLKALQFFVELAASDSIRQAAQRIGIAPTAASRLIDQLEYHFRTELIDRGSSGIRLTEAGTLLVERARTIVLEIDATRALIDDLRGLQRGRVTIRAGGAVVAGLLAPVLCEISLHYPGLRFHIDVASAGEVFAAVSEGTADIGVTIFSPDSARVLICQSRPISHRVIVSTDHPFAGQQAVSMEQLVRQPLAIPDIAFGVRQDLERIARAASVRLDPVFVTGSLEMQKELAVRGAAALVLPALCCRREIEAGLLRAVRLDPGDAISTTLDLCRAHSRAVSFATRIVLDVLERFMKTRLEADLVQ